MANNFENNAVEKFREYLRINTTTNHANYAAAVAFLQRYANELNCQFRTVELVAGKPICILIFPGTSFAHETIMLNSHIDVVPSDATSWSHPPFAAEMVDGIIYGRGTTDTKQVGIQYLEAMRKLREEKVSLKRTVALTFVPDEEIGGLDGMCKFVESDEFRSMNIVFCLDEGMASPNRSIKLHDCEKYKMPFRFTIDGDAGHSSLFLNNTAAEKLARLLDEIYNFRDEQRMKIGKCIDGKTIETLDVAATNVTVVSGGLGENVIPNRIQCLVDCRVPPNILPNDFHKLIGQIVRKAIARTSAVVLPAEEDDLLSGCGGIHIESVRASEFASINPNLLLKDLLRNSKYRCGIEDACKKFGIDCHWDQLQGQTDGRFLRRKGVPVLNVSPLYGIQNRAHQVNEHIHRELFLEGIQFYYCLIPEVVNTD